MDESIVPERFFDAPEEPEQVLVPIVGYENSPQVTLREAVEPIKSLLFDAEAMIAIARRNCRKPADGLTQDESSAIHLFTMQWPQPHRSLSTLLNERLRSQNRDSLRPWFPFLKLFLTALHKLPSVSGIVWRGARGNLSDFYEDDQIWWGASSCVESELKTEQLMGNEDVRTIFHIECFHGKSIRSHSYTHTLNEIILPPGSYFEVVDKDRQSKDSYIIHLQEKIPTYRTIASPFELPLSPQKPMPTVTPVEAAPVLSFAGDHSDNESQIAAPVKAQNTHLEAKRTLFKASARKSMSFRLKKFSDSAPECTFYAEPQHVVTVAGGNEQGERLNQLSLPEGIFVDEDNSIYIADCWNHRLAQWKYEATTGDIVVGSTGSGKRADQLNMPSDIIVDKSSRAFIIADQGNRRVIRWFGQRQNVLIDKIDCYALAMDKHGFLYVSDYQKHEVRRWRVGDNEGTVVAGGHGCGKHRNQLNYPTYIFVGEDQSVYVSDTFNDRVMRWTKGAREGVVVAGGNGHGNSLKQLSSPRGVLVDRRGHIYVADSGNDRVVRWREGDEEGLLFDAPNGEGVDPLKCPTGLAFDEEGCLYVVDQGHHRVRKYPIFLDY